MTPKNASAEARRHLRLLAGELGVSVRGVSDDDLNIVAIRFVLDGRVTTDALQAIVDDVREGSGSAGAAPLAAKGKAVPLAPSGAGESGQATGADEGPQEPALSPTPPHRGMHYLATEATAAKMRHRLRLAHAAEDSRAALYVVPRTPEILPAGKPHPSCLAAAREGLEGSVCSRPACQWLLGKDDPYIDAWLDRDDSTGGRL